MKGTGQEAEGHARPRRVHQRRLQLLGARGEQAQRRRRHRQPQRRCWQRWQRCGRGRRGCSLDLYQCRLQQLHTLHDFAVGSLGRRSKAGAGEGVGSKSAWVARNSAALVGVGKSAAAQPRLSVPSLKSRQLAVHSHTQSAALQPKCVPQMRPPSSIKQAIVAQTTATIRCKRTQHNKLTSSPRSMISVSRPSSPPLAACTMRLTSAEGTRGTRGAGGRARGVRRRGTQQQKLTRASDAKGASCRC